MQIKKISNKRGKKKKRREKKRKEKKRKEKKRKEKKRQYKTRQDKTGDKGNVMTELSRVDSNRTEQGMKSGCCVTQMSPKAF